MSLVSPVFADNPLYAITLAEFLEGEADEAVEFFAWLDRLAHHLATHGRLTQVFLEEPAELVPAIRCGTIMVFPDRPPFARDREPARFLFYRRKGRGWNLHFSSQLELWGFPSSLVPFRKHRCWEVIEDPVAAEPQDRTAISVASPGSWITWPAILEEWKRRHPEGAGRKISKEGLHP